MEHSSWLKGSRSDKIMPVVYTIGYEGASIEEFQKTLSIVGISLVADIRAIPVSRKRGFSKISLAERLAKVGIEYQHFGELGDPKPGREAARAGQYPTFESIYRLHLESREARAAIADLLKLVALRPTCLLCFERNPRHCHRTIVAKQLADLSGFDTFDLVSDDPERYVRLSKQMPGSNSG